MKSTVVGTTVGLSVPPRAVNSHAENTTGKTAVAWPSPPHVATADAVTVRPTWAASSSGARRKWTSLLLAGLRVDVVTLTQPVLPAVPAGAVAHGGRPGPEPHSSVTLVAPSLAFLLA